MLLSARQMRDGRQEATARFASGMAQERGSQHFALSRFNHEVSNSSGKGSWAIFTPRGDAPPSCCL